MSVAPWYLRKLEKAHMAKPEGPRKHPLHIAHVMGPDANAWIPKPSWVSSRVWWGEGH